MNRSEEELYIEFDILTATIRQAQDLELLPARSSWRLNNDQYMTDLIRELEKALIDESPSTALQPKSSLGIWSKSEELLDRFFQIVQISPHPMAVSIRSWCNGDLRSNGYIEQVVRKTANSLKTA